MSPSHINVVPIIFFMWFKCTECGLDPLLFQIPYNQRDTFCSMINHCDKYVTHLQEMDIFFCTVNTSSKFHLYLLSPRQRVAKGYSTATVRPSVTSLWTL